MIQNVSLRNSSGILGIWGMTSEFEFFSKVYVVTGMNKSQYIFKLIEIFNFQTNHETC